MMNTWKKAGALFFTGVFAFGMCMGVSAEEQTDVVVFAAASMTETLTEIQEMYKEVEPNVNLVFTFDSSGTLKTQIEEGADCDLFISAAQKQMNQLDITADPSVNEDGLDLLMMLPESIFWKIKLCWRYRKIIRQISSPLKIW